MNKGCLVLVISLLWGFSISAQEYYTISGVVADEKNELLIGANVYLLETLNGSTTNLSGQYQIRNVEEGTYKLVTSVLGYATDSTSLMVSSDIEKNMVLVESAISLGEIEIVADRIAERTTISNVSMDRKTLETSQGLTEDPVRTLAMLPGIGRTGDLFSPSQIYVRGGAPDENLFLMDNNKLYFPWYFGGQKSVFNTEVLESIELLTGGFSAAYGNHMSSVMNVQTRDGSLVNTRGNISLGFYNASGTVEGPIIREKLSFLLSVRRTYLDLFLDESASFPVLEWGDITYKLSYLINPNHKISLSGLSSTEATDFIAKDQEPGLPNKMQIGAKNHFQSLQLKSTIGSKFYNKLSVTNGNNINESEIGSTLFLDIDAQQSGVRDDLTYYISNKHKLKGGVEWQYGRFDLTGNSPLDPLQTDPNDTTVTLRILDQHSKGEVIRSGYLLYDGNPISKVGINVGIRVDQNPSSGYTDLSPRISLNYQLTKKSKLRAATGIYYQFPGGEAPNTIKSSSATHYIVGYEYHVSKNLYGWIEGYYKAYNDLVIYDQNLVYSNEGEGSSKGIEFLIRKEGGIFKGWISYALSYSERTAPLTNVITDFEFDQRHIFNLVAEYKIPRKDTQWYIPALAQINFRFADGTPYTPVTGATNDGTGWKQVQGAPLSARNNDYLNLNVRVEWAIKIVEKIKGASFMEVWNVLNNKNVLGRNYQYGSQYANNVLENTYYGTPILFGGGFKFWFGKYN